MVEASKKTSVEHLRGEICTGLTLLGFDPQCKPAKAATCSEKTIFPEGLSREGMTLVEDNGNEIQHPSSMAAVEGVGTAEPWPGSISDQLP